MSEINEEQLLSFKEVDRIEILKQIILGNIKYTGR